MKIVGRKFVLTFFHLLISFTVSHSCQKQVMITKREKRGKKVQDIWVNTGELST